MPAYTMLTRSPSAAVQAGGSRRRVFVTGTLSPVSADSSTLRPLDLDETRVGRHVVAGLEDACTSPGTTRGGRHRRLDAVTTDERAQVVVLRRDVNTRSTRRSVT